MPWYIARGNHDGLVQGNAPASTDLFRAIAVGCLKVFPTPAVDPAQFAGQDEAALFRRFADPAFISSLLAGGRTVPPDPDRRIVSKREFRDELAVGSCSAHGFGVTPPRRAAALARDGELLRGHAAAGMRFISIDTVAEGGAPWATSTTRSTAGSRRELRRAQRRDELVDRLRPPHARDDVQHRDRRGGRDVRPAGEPGCDARSAPLHAAAPRADGTGDGPRAAAGTPNVVAYVSGHTHANAVRFYGGRRGRGFWEVNTASHIDWPQQSRLIEVMDNRDGTLSIFGTVLDTAAPTAAPAPGPASAFSTTELVSLARTLSYNDPQRLDAEGGRQQRESWARAATATSSCWCATHAEHNVDRVLRLGATVRARWTRWSSSSGSASACSSASRASAVGRS